MNPNSNNAIGQWSPGIIPEGIKVIPEVGILLPGTEVNLIIEVEKSFDVPQIWSIDIAGGSPVFFDIST